MNYKLEKFWNESKKNNNDIKVPMNYKLEKFWNITPLNNKNVFICHEL